jgi:creatinine amidohydrolase
MRSLATSTWHDAQSQNDRVLLVPLGATEQHGPHLPLTTDTDIAVALAQRLAAALPDTVVVAPAVPYGSSGEHEGFAGTLSIGQAATEHLLVELGRSATRTWPHVMLVCAHGGNAAPVARAIRRLQDEGRDVRAWTPSWQDAHAGRWETSVMLALAPERVDIEAAAPGATEPLAELLPALMERGVAAVSPNGVLGDPIGASADAGARLLDAALASLRAAVLAPAPVDA